VKIFISRHRVLIIKFHRTFTICELHIHGFYPFYIYVAVTQTTWSGKPGMQAHKFYLKGSTDAQAQPERRQKCLGINTTSSARSVANPIKVKCQNSVGIAERNLSMTAIPRHRPGQSHSHTASHNLRTNMKKKEKKENSLGGNGF